MSRGRSCSAVTGRTISCGQKADLWYAVYHRRPLTETDGNHRVTCIDRMEFDAEGLIKPIKLTHQGVESRALGWSTPDKPAKEKH